MTEFIAIVLSHIFILYIIMRAARLAREEDQPSGIRIDIPPADDR